MANDKFIRIKKQDHFLVATMPNGDVIPMQDKMSITQDADQKGYVHVHFTAKIPIHLFNIEEDEETT